MTDENLPVVDPPPDPAAATVSADLSLIYQLRSISHPSSDLEVVGRSEAPSVGPHAHEDLPGPETVPLSQSVEPFDSFQPVEISSSTLYEEEVETTSHPIVSSVGS